MFGEEEQARSALEEYPEGTTLQIRYNPRKPLDNVLEIEDVVRGSGLIVFGILCLVVGIVLGFVG